MIVLTVLSRPGCHLCDELIDELLPLIAGLARIDVVDISDDEDLLRRYCLEIPVVKHGDEELSRYRLDRERVASFLERRAH
jgi:thioredoxin reductase (NADPH)